MKIILSVGKNNIEYLSDFQNKIGIEILKDTKDLWKS